MWLEMSRDPDHGGSGWAFTECLWSPTRKKKKAGGTGSKWPFWQSLMDIKKGDFVFHLRGPTGKAGFVGYSIADSEGYLTLKCPPKLNKKWAYSTEFYRVPLTDFTPFPTPILLSNVFKHKSVELELYLSSKPKHSKRVFYVHQKGRLQCLNGAYLSYLDEELANIIFGRAFSDPDPNHIIHSVDTDEILAQCHRRIGQDKFSEAVRKNYASKCCFPKCEVSEDAFLVGSHIARWADAPGSRGKIENGLCLCLLHDRAFEKGLFTLNANYEVRVNPSRADQSVWATKNLNPFNKKAIKQGLITPSIDLLNLHWSRIKFIPS